MMLTLLIIIAVIIMRISGNVSINIDIKCKYCY